MYLSVNNRRYRDWMKRMLLRSAQEVATLVASELDYIADRERREALQAILIEPTLEHRTWEYGEEDMQYPCWLIARDPNGDVALAFSNYGHGDPWGRVLIGDQWFGMDSDWFSSLDDVFIFALWRGPLPPGYEVS